MTVPLSRLGRPLEGVEIDAVRARSLRRRVGPHVCISEGDILRHAPPVGSTVVSNVPFSLTTPVLRHLLHSPGWVRAVLLVQWEVAKKRAGVGGTTQLTAQWWPWLDFTLDRRVPATAFRPRPSVDGGILVIDRRERPLLPVRQRRGYQAWVRQVFAGPGRGLPDILARTGRLTHAQAAQFCRDQELDPRTLPRDLTVPQWVQAFAGSTPRSGAAVGVQSGQRVEGDLHLAQRVAEPAEHVQPRVGGGQHPPGQPRPQRREPRVVQHRLDPAAVTAAHHRLQVGRDRPRTAYAASAAAAYARSAWFSRRRAKRCCDQPPALVRPWT